MTFHLQTPNGESLEFNLSQVKALLGVQQDPDFEFTLPTLDAETMKNVSEEQRMMSGQTIKAPYLALENAMRPMVVNYNLICKFLKYTQVKTRYTEQKFMEFVIQLTDEELEKLFEDISYEFTDPDAPAVVKKMVPAES